MVVICGIDVKNDFYVFIPVTFFYVFYVFYFVNVFLFFENVN